MKRRGGSNKVCSCSIYGLLFSLSLSLSLSIPMEFPRFDHRAGRGEDMGTS